MTVTLPQVLLTLDHLPIANRNQLQDNKILTVVRRWAEREGKVKQQLQENSETMELIEGTIVSEADSAPCDGVEGGGSVAGGVAKEEEGSCEAEAREASATESQGLLTQLVHVLVLSVGPCNLSVYCTAA